MCVQILRISSFKYTYLCICLYLIIHKYVYVYNNSIYIDETSKTAYKRLVEHWLATCNKNVNLSGIAQHFNFYQNSHILSKDKPLLSLKIIDRANSYTERINKRSSLDK